MACIPIRKIREMQALDVYLSVGKETVGVA